MKKGPLDRPLTTKGGKEVSMAAFAYLFSTIIKDAQVSGRLVRKVGS